MLAAAAQSDYQRLVWLCGMVYCVCAALRLARFNVETTLDDESTLILTTDGDYFRFLKEMQRD